MRLAIDLSRENLVQGTGGPFGAAVFELPAYRLVSVGVNVVVPQHTSLAHAEILALLLAQEALLTHDLGKRRLELVTSSQPCLQCYGAIFWSGLSRVVTGARAKDVEALAGSDEGPLPQDWEGEWRKRGISLETDVMRVQACAVLQAYQESGAPIYNPARSTP
ncbi:MAG: nucleoside deaminase [Spirochaetales bacterium]|nr:nucleoside deaminase [Spirochaetales bacterium]